MTSKFLLLFLGFTLAFAACKKDEDTKPADTPSNQILVGVGITGISIGGPAQQAIDKYGSTSPSFFSLGGQYSHFLIYSGVVVYCEQTTDATFNAQMKIASIIVSEPYDGKTNDKNIGIGSKKSDVIAAYGQPVNTFFGDEYANGLTFNYGSDGVTVESIEIEKP